MRQLYYPVGGNDFINTTEYIEYSNNLQNIYLNVENNISIPIFSFIFLQCIC